MTMPRLRLLIASAVVPCLLVLGCGDDTSADGGGGSPAAGGAGGGDVGGAGASDGGGLGEGGYSPGDPIVADPENWTWVDVEGTKCIDGSPTGIGINIAGGNEEDLVFFLGGGNACFNEVTCGITANTDGYGEDKFAEEGNIGAQLFTRTGMTNAFRTWNYVFVPYCSGDIHAGHRADVEVGDDTWQFHGYRNITRILERVVPTFPNVRRVLLVGVSAGGFGAFFNYAQVKDAFGDDVQVYLADDSGPPMGSDYLSGCLQGHLSETWGLNLTGSAHCPECFEGDVWVEPYFDYLMTAYADQRFGLLVSEQDQTMRTFWGFGTNDCADLESGLPPPYSAALFTEGILDLRDRIADDNPFFGLYMPPGSTHVLLNDLNIHTQFFEGGPTPMQWLELLVNEEITWQHWPQP